MMQSKVICSGTACRARFCGKSMPNLSLRA
jgi:hypothetical protein